MAIHVGCSSWSAHVFSWLGDLNRLRLWLADDCLTDFLRFADDTLLANDSWVWNDSLDVDNLWLGDNSLLVHDARLTDDLRLINQLRLADFFRLWHNVSVNHSALGVDDFLLANDPWWLLYLDELRTTFLRGADGWALWHRAEILVGVAFRSAL